MSDTPEVKAVNIHDIYKATKREGETLGEWRSEWLRLSDDEKEWYRTHVSTEVK